MSKHLCKLLLVLLLGLILTAASMLLLGHAATDVAAQPQVSEVKTLDRDLEPVVVKGWQLGALRGVPVNDLYVYVFSGNSLSGPIPVQVDEVTASGSYTGTEDGLLDANDEIAFMAKDAGDQPTDTAELDTLPVSTDWYEIEIIDPLDPAKKGWAYLVRRNIPVLVGGDFVDYVPSTRHITTNPERYTLGLATTILGPDYLTLNGNSTDILDRIKLRVASSLFPTLTEDEIVAADVVLIRDGQVRVILQQPVDVGVARLTATYLAYNSFVQSLTNVDSSVTVSSARVSADFSSTASGATFYNANSTGGVTIDGNPDVVNATPLSYWSQVSHTTGRIIHVFDPTPIGGTCRNYYCDDIADTSECDGTQRTGDNGSYGDAGVLIEGDMNQTFTIQNQLYVLSPSNGSQDNVGATYEDYFFNPLVTKSFWRGRRTATFLPIILKSVP